MRHRIIVSYEVKKPFFHKAKTATDNEWQQNISTTT